MLPISQGFFLPQGPTAVAEMVMDPVQVSGGVLPFIHPNYHPDVFFTLIYIPSGNGSSQDFYPFSLSRIYRSCAFTRPRILYLVPGYMEQFYF